MTLNSILLPLFFLIIFPGFLFLSLYGFFLEWLDKKCLNLIKNKPGPAIYRPIADFIQLLSKETFIPKHCDTILFKSPPFLAIAAITTSMLSIPVWEKALFSFQGDLIVTLYLLMIPAITFSLANRSSNTPFEAVEELRTSTQLFAYEVLFMLALLAPAIIAGSWNIIEISKFMFHRPLLLILQIPAFLIALITLQGKLKRLHFDTPYNKTEAGEGSSGGSAFGEVSPFRGGLLAFSNLAINMEMVAGAALINAIFFGGAFNATGLSAIGLFILKTIFIVFLLSIIKTLMARIRIKQMMNFCRKILTPLILAQMALNILIKIKMQ